MNPIAVLGGLLAAGMLVSQRTGRLSISSPMLFVALGLLCGPSALGLLDLSLGAEFTKELAEITLGVLLFADAATLRTRQVASEANLVSRLLLIGLPLTLLLGGALAWIIFPDEPIGVVLLIASALSPTDAALGLPIFSNPHIPARIRLGLNVESGINDGIVTPFVTLFIALSLAEAHDGNEHWLQSALSEIAIAVAVGVAIGSVGGWLIRQALERQSTTMSGARIAFLSVALAAFFAAGNWDGNRFIAAFVGGLFAGTLMRSHAHEVIEYAETTGSALASVVWIVFGALLVPPALGEAFSIRALLFGLLSLTIMRMLPVAIGMFGTGLRLDTVAMMGWFGPRGMASVVFLVTAIAAFEEAGQSIELLVGAMTWTILLSVVLHGVSADPLGRWYGARLAAARCDIPEHRGASPDSHGFGPLPTHEPASPPN